MELRADTARLGPLGLAQCKRQGVLTARISDRPRVKDGWGCNVKVANIQCTYLILYFIAFLLVFQDFLQQKSLIQNHHGVRD